MGQEPLLTADAVVQEDVFVSMGKIQYLLAPTLENIQAANNWPGDTHPVVVFATHQNDRITKAQLHSFHKDVLLLDDIFQPSFLTKIIFYGAEKGELVLDPEASKLIEEWGTTDIEYIASGAFHGQVAQGPYIIHRGHLCQPWRIYDDHAETLMMSFMPCNLNDRKPCKALDSSVGSTRMRVAVPPRSYFQKSSERPLGGVRIVVKDSFDIAGFPTSLCNRAWRDLYPAPLDTAPCVQNLIEKGAIVIGKAKLQAMIVREDTMECVDFPAPFNPRGDGYQTASGSSNGSCASIGTYDWLDFSIGSDSKHHSVELHTSWNKSLMTSGQRMQAVESQDNIMAALRFDQPTVCSRIEVWLAISLRSYPSVSRDYLPTVNEAQMRLIDSFVTNLEAALGVKKTLLSLKDTWAANPLAGAGSDMAEYLKTAGWLPFFYDTDQIIQRFRHDYRTKFGKSPFIHAHLRWRSEAAKDITPSERNNQYERLLVQRNWLRNHIFASQTPAHQKQTNIFMVLPIEDGKPNYRERPPQPYEKASALSAMYISSVAGTPEIVAPIGEIKFLSEVTERVEPLPIAVSVVGAPGTDLWLMEVVRKAMELGGLPTRLETGRSIYGEGTAYSV